MNDMKLFGVNSKMINLFVRKPRGFKNLRVAPFNVRNETGD